MKYEYQLQLSLFGKLLAIFEIYFDVHNVSCSELAFQGNLVAV